MSYRGPNAQRLQAQHAQIQQHAGETGIWRQYVSASTGTASGYWAGAGITRHYREQVISGLWAWAAQQETQVAGGQIMAGDAMLSTRQPLGPQDEVVWRGVTYRIEGDTMPVHLGGRLWYQTPLRRGDATG